MIFRDFMRPSGNAPEGEEAKKKTKKEKDKEGMLHAATRIRLLTDEGSFQETDAALVGNDPLEFPGYEEKLEAGRKKGGTNEAVICGKAKISGCPVYIFAMEAGFMMGSMGSAVGEKITRVFEEATAEKLPVVGITVSGGARMQEGIFSLMQMAKVSAAVKKHSDAGLFYLALLTNPTMGGVEASFAMQADIILGEPSARVGFAGPRVIEAAYRKKLPAGFQMSESVLEHGFLDAIVPRGKQKETIGWLLRLHAERNGEENGRI